MSDSPAIHESRITAPTIIRLLLIAGAAVFLVLHALHLNADFPNYSPWMDWSKYTDEGWYGDGAIRHFQRGHWYVPGDFNPAAALPVWPLLESLVFRFTGVSAAAARALTVGVFGLILFSSYLLLNRYQNLYSATRKNSSLAPAIAVLLLAVSPFCYVFTRLAILEPMLVLLTLLALLAASYTEPKGQGIARDKQKLRRYLPILALGLLLPLMVLTKTTAIFLIPAIAWLLWARAGYRLRPFLRASVSAAVIAAFIWLGYYGLVVHPHYLDDYRYLFSANAYTGITPSNIFSVLGETIADGLWMGYLLYPLALVAIGITFLVSPRLLRNPLIPALLLWAAGYAAFLAYHNNLQPRYYLVIAVPLTLLLALVFESIWSGPGLKGYRHHLVASGAVAALVILVATDARQTLHYVRNPEYTFVSAAAQINEIVSADHTHNPLVLSISGSNLSLMTGLPSICDDFGTMDLAVRVKAYSPGWYVAWNQVDDDKMDALTPIYHLQRVAAFPAMDDPERNLLILYRLDPPLPNAPIRPPHRKPVPRLLQTSLGQQPSVVQLEH
jgi:4-amino-4-deoxy-L-arabinose transferase-like glycosyltransferase